jgi:hypothetical protein
MSGKIHYPATRASSKGYDLATREQLLEHLAESGSLRAVCKLPGMPSARQVHRWLQEDVEFASAYARAKSIGIQLFVDEMLEIADAPMAPQNVAQAKLRVETRRWLAERMLPKLYGPTSALQLEGKLEVKSDPSARRARIASIVAIAEKRKADEEAGRDLA